MPNPNRESSHRLSNEERTQSLSLSASIQPVLNDEIQKAKSQFPEFFTTLEDKSQMISIDISQIVTELINSLNLTFDKPLTIQFGILERGTNAFVEYDDQGKTRIVISLAFLENISKMTQKGHGFEANAQLRYLLAHEFFHLYSKIKYPSAMLKSAEATKNNREKKVAYDLDFGERSAELFAIKHLLDQSEDDLDQKKANEKLANEKKTELRNRLIAARIKQKLKSFFSK